MHLKIVEVVLLLLAGVLFVAWQFRDLRRAKEITRLQRDAEINPAMQASTKSDEGPSVKSLERDVR